MQNRRWPKPELIGDLQDMLSSLDFVGTGLGPRDNLDQEEQRAIVRSDSMRRFDGYFGGAVSIANRKWRPRG